MATATIFKAFKEHLVNARVNYPADTIKMALCTSLYTPDYDLHDYFNDVTNEVVGTGYTAGGAALASKTVTRTAANSLTAWAANTAYVVGDVRRPTTGNGHAYICVVAGTSHATTEPTWPTVAHQTVVDNTVTWAEVGASVTVLDAADPTWTGATITARKGIVYKDTGTASTSPLIACVDFGSDITSTAATFTAVLDARGIARLFA